MPFPFTLTVLTFGVLTSIQGYPLDGSKQGQKDFQNSLELSDKLNVKWEVNNSEKKVTFELTSTTVGYLGFGISDSGSMFGADVIIGGVNADGSSYFTDRFATETYEPKVDDSQDWILEYFKEENGGTVLKFYRNFETGDTKEDFVIENKETYFIYAIGSGDSVIYHDFMGKAKVNILKSPGPPSGPPDFSNSLTLNEGQGYKVDWHVYLNDQKVLFELTSATIGWLGFGIADSGSMTKADLIIGGVNADTTPYFSDRYADGFAEPLVDGVQNWVLIDALEENGGTKLRFYRDFVTGDDGQDNSIADKETFFIFALGSDDAINYHASRGQVSVNILKNPGPPIGSPDFTNELSMDNGVTLKWDVHQKEEKVVFELRSPTTGWLGLGISDTGDMNGADLIIGGVTDNGNSYFSDRFATSPAEPEVDSKQDWFLVDFNEENGETYLKFYRNFDTKDDKDFVIQDKEIYLIYAIGSTDTIGYHQARGKVKTNILKNNGPPIGSSDFSNHLVLNEAQGYKVDWHIYMKEQKILFELTSATIGWLGFGIADSGSMTKADLIIGGVNADSTPYFNDRYADGFVEPTIDGVQNWFLIDAVEENGGTKLRFYREFETKDLEDNLIENRETNFIFALGTSDEIAYHANRGKVKVNILKRPGAPTGPPDFSNSLTLYAGYHVDWHVYLNDQKVLFELSSSTTGYLGFGISDSGSMTQADLIIGGVNSDGTPYFLDRHANGFVEPPVDAVQNWFLIEASEDATGTKLKFYRDFVTGDAEDNPLEDKETFFIFALGENDAIAYHILRGQVKVNVLQDPNEVTTTTEYITTTPPPDISDFNSTLVLTEGLTIEWAVLVEKEEIIFQLKSATQGWLGFGISDVGSMFGADVIMGGVNPDGSLYFNDCYASSTVVPEVDVQQDWVLLDATESNGETVLQFLRKFDTGDAQDIAIEYKQTYFIWATGESDTIEYHQAKRGKVKLNILLNPADPITTQPPVPTTTVAPPSGLPDFSNTRTLRNKLTIDWHVYLEQEQIIFELKSSTEGWLGFGLSLTGNMREGDMIMGGIHQNGSSYFTDRFATAPSEPEIDESQDWFLMDARIEDGLNILKFYRNFDTGDDNDVHIEKNVEIFFIWAVGSTDQIGYHEARGSLKVNVLQNPIDEGTTEAPVTVPPPSNSSDFNNTIILRDGYTVNWQVFLQDQKVLFELRSTVDAWLGFGISPSGTMRGADVIMGGVNGDGSTYFNDRYSTIPEEPKIDESQDWFLLSGTIEDGVTVLKFYRNFQTGDSADFPIEDLDTFFIWAIGRSDNIGQHEFRGKEKVNILQDPAQAGTTETPVTIPPPTGDPDFSHSGSLREGFDLTWHVYLSQEQVVFEVTSTSVGWVAFGISEKGNMFDSDVVTGGVNLDGTDYFEDRWSVTTGEPDIDDQQDWFLLEAKEENGVTYLKFHRMFVTDDAKDLDIENKETKVIWAVGPNDDMGYHAGDRGSASVNVLSKEPTLTVTKSPEGAKKKTTPLWAIGICMGLLLTGLLVDTIRTRKWHPA